MDGTAESFDAPETQSPQPLFAVRCERPLLVASFSAPVTVLSWATARPGRRLARRVVWLEVEDADLPPEVDPAALLDARLAGVGISDAVAMMTARDVRRHHVAVARSSAVTAQCLATAGLSNAGRVGVACRDRAPVGTINLLAAVSTSLTEAALLEAVSIATEARTAAVIDCAYETLGGVATGTGTDCIAVACPADGEAAPFAGLHTSVGEALGAAVYDAVRAGTREWIDGHSTQP
jgi:adenosylcobinamide amidohydrolase